MLYDYMKSPVIQIRKALDALALADGVDNDEKEVIYDRELATIREMDREGIIEAVSKAVGNNSKRKRFAPFIFSELYDVPGIEDVFQVLLENADANGRADIIQTIGLRRMKSLVGVLNGHFAREADDFCRDCLLHSLGVLADESSLSIFVYLMQKTDRRDEWRILTAARHFARQDFKEYVSRVFEDDHTETTHKVMAAWSLAKLGEGRPYEYLVHMLFDPEVRTPNLYDPRHSLRAAQAICDVNSWDFEWNKDSVEKVKARLHETKN